MEQAQATLAAAQANAVQTDAEYERQASLGRTDFASRSAVDQARAARDSNRAAVTNDQAGVTLAAINLGYTQVTAPFDGLVTAHQVLGRQPCRRQLAHDAGDDHPIRSMSSFTVSEQDVPGSRAACGRRIDRWDFDKVPVELGLMTETGYPHKGHLDYASPNVDASTGTLMVRGILPNPDYVLLPQACACVCRCRRRRRKRIAGARHGAGNRSGRTIPAGGGQG